MYGIYTLIVASYGAYGTAKSSTAPPVLLLSVGGRRQPRDRVYRVGFRRWLVLAVTQYPGEPQGDTARVSRGALDAVEGDLDHEFWTHVDRPVVAVVLERQQFLCLPGQQLVREALEGLAQHDPAACFRVARSQVQVG